MTQDFTSSLGTSASETDLDPDEIAGLCTNRYGDSDAFEKSLPECLPWDALDGEEATQRPLA